MEGIGGGARWPDRGFLFMQELHHHLEWDHRRLRSCATKPRRSLVEKMEGWNKRNCHVWRQADMLSPCSSDSRDGERETHTRTEKRRGEAEERRKWYIIDLTSINPALPDTTRAPFRTRIQRSLLPFYAFTFAASTAFPPHFLLSHFQSSFPPSVCPASQLLPSSMSFLPQQQQQQRERQEGPGGGGKGTLPMRKVNKNKNFSLIAHEKM